MKRKTVNDRLIGAFGAAGGALVLGTILSQLIFGQWSLWLFATFEIVGALFIILAILLYLRK
jgi:hypothetical protein